MKASVRYHFTTVKMAIIKQDTETSVCQDTEKTKPSHTVGRNTNWWKIVRRSLKKETKNRITL